MPSPVDSLQLAYGDRRYVKMTKELSHGTDVIRVKVLNELNEDFRRSDFITLSLQSSEILKALVALLAHTSAEIRLLVVRLLNQMCMTQLGRDTIVAIESLSHIINTINDTEQKIRMFGYKTIINFCDNLGFNTILK